MDRPPLRRILLPALVGARVALPLSAHAQFPPTLDQVRKAWERRQDLVRNAQVRWVEKTTYAKGYVSRQVPAFQIGCPEGTVVPPADATFEVPRAIAFEGEKFRYDYHRWSWNHKRGGFVPTPETSVHDGQSLRTLTSQGYHRADVPTATVKKGSERNEAYIVNYRPLMLAFRPTDPNFVPVEMDTLRVTGRRAVVGGANCWELERRDDKGKTRVAARWWVDPARDYVVRRYTVTINDRLSTRLDVRYAEHPLAGWAPTAWDLDQFFDDGALKAAYRCAVAEMVLNAELPRETWEVPFPVGTSVMDSSGPSLALYVVRDDGSKRTLTGADLQKSYEEVLATDPCGPSARRGWFGFWAALAAFGGASVALVWRRRPRRDRRRPAGSAGRNTMEGGVGCD